MPDTNIALDQCRTRIESGYWVIVNDRGDYLTSTGWDSRLSHATWFLPEAAFDVLSTLSDSVAILISLIDKAYPDA